MKFDVLNRWNGQVSFTADIDCDETAARSVKLGLAVSWARKTNADLRDANLSGADLRDAILSGAILSGADLRDAILSGANLRDAILRGANLRDAILRGADLRDAILSDADLSGAILSDADLRGADLSGVPRIPDIHKAVYAAASRDGALDMSQWHCGTAHCRAGWVVTLAGGAGAAMEYCIGTSAAAALIYLASDPTINRIPDFYCGNEAALADMARLAGIEQQQEAKS